MYVDIRKTKPKPNLPGSKEMDHWSFADFKSASWLEVSKTVCEVFAKVGEH